MPFKSAKFYEIFIMDIYDFISLFLDFFYHQEKIMIMVIYKSGAWIYGEAW